MKQRGRNSMSWQLRLYVRGSSPIAQMTIENVRSFCEAHLPTKYELEVIDIDEDTAAAEQDNIIAIPTLVRLAPNPVRRIVGNFSQTDRVRVALGVGSGAERLERGFEA